MPPPKLSLAFSEVNDVPEGESGRRYAIDGDTFRPISTWAKAAGATANAATVRNTFFIVKVERLLGTWQYSVGCKGVILYKTSSNLKISLYTKALALAVAVLLAGCRQGSDSNCRPDPAADAPAAPLHLEHLERPFFQIKNPVEGLQFMRAHPAFARYYLQVGQAPSAEALASSLAQLATNPDLQKLSRETATAFTDSATLRHDLGTMFGRVKYYFPDFKTPPTAATYVSGLLGKDIFVNDSLLVLSLDWYIGPKATYRPDIPV
jgi:hypothetical protein